MKITVELPDNELREICEITGIRKKGPAIRKLVEDSLMIERRKRIARKFVDGTYSAELSGFEEAKEIERRASQSLSELWRD
ncbi:MAG: hypothetical protein NWT08_07305 [Akkermansiaceae bacterium]|jgi:hypothetical protein|nr:hypothetical protein [Akkermansiaceae bacterium]MDP4645865.1 hypothetical protein [Akkermansiaceae bacterium]MDP4720421.1 hypothetical protein [Akkermansiaceae bacterium]MDP4779185.1 hypothetical protein [Akkermansiaceae bacterium]MDP4848202.1 hypothetical protein [Akkermansiaceae bacterium]